MNEETLNEWYNRMTAHARKNYTAGWDFFVECIGASDFRREVAGAGLTDYESVFQYYAEWCELRHEREQEVRSEAW